VLCGHSYGGMVITEAGTDQRVAQLLYVTSMMPEAGQSLADLVGSQPAPWMDPGDDGTVGVHADIVPGSCLSRTATPLAGDDAGQSRAGTGPASAGHGLGVLGGPGCTRSAWTPRWPRAGRGRTAGRTGPGRGPHRGRPASHILRGLVPGETAAMQFHKHIEEFDKDGAEAVALVPVSSRGRRSG
jgi:hypothetical protein